MKNLFFIGLVLITSLSACIDPPQYPNEPQIEFLSVNKTQLVAQTIPEDQNRPTDTLFITFAFTDGDGDLGGGDTSNVFVNDSRLTNGGETFFISDIPQQGVTNGISGEIRVTIPSVFCFANSAPRDTVSFSIQIMDKAGNKSNLIQTPPIELICD